MSGTDHGEPIELTVRRAGAGRAVDGFPRPVSAELGRALREWSRICGALHGVLGTSERRRGARTLLGRRGEQLAMRLAAEQGHPVDYRDPFGQRSRLVLPPAAAPGEREPTPWVTGVLLAAAVLAVAVLAVLVLITQLARVSPWLAGPVGVVVVAVLVPPLMRLRAVPVWRWVGVGAALGLLAGGVGGLAVLLS